MAISPDDPLMGGDYPDVQQPADAGFFVPEGMESLLRLQEFAASDNAATLLSEDVLRDSGRRVVTEYQDDKDSRSDWEEDNRQTMKLARQVREDKTFPWPGAANVKFPLLAEAAITFAARAYPEIVQGKDVVKCAVEGDDPQGQKAQRAQRISDHMSWQLINQMEEWEEDTDRLLVSLPLVGSCFRKTYYDPVRGRNVSKLVPAEDFIVSNHAGSLDLARRETERFDLYTNDVLEKQRGGLWLDVELRADSEDDRPDDHYVFLEQHRWLDLDEDGYEEPYIVTVHEATQQVVRVVARFSADQIKINARNEVVRIEADRYYTHYYFMPDPQGGLYGVGFGKLLTPINESIDTVLNQLLDAGTLANMQGGFLGKGVKVRTGQLRIGPGEWKPVESTGGDLKSNIVPLPFKEPSIVLFQLLGLLIDTGKGLASIKDVLSGDLPAANVPATTVLALIEQGQKVYTAIHKRIFRSMKREFEKLYRLNAEYLDEREYFTVLDNRQAIAQQDYQQGDYDVSPVADPHLSNRAQRLAQAQALMQLRGQPGINTPEIDKEYLTAIGVDQPERFIAQQQGPDPLMVLQMENLQREAARKDAETITQAAKTLAEIVEIRAKTMKYIAEAESEEMGTQLAQYKSFLDAMEAQVRSQITPTESVNNGPNPRGMGGMAPAPGNAVVPGGSGANPAGLAGGVGYGPNPPGII